MYTISHKRTANISVWRSGLKTLFRGDYNNIYLLHKYHKLEWKYFSFHGLAWKHFTAYIIRQTNYIISQIRLVVRLKNITLWGLSATDFETMAWCMLCYYISCLYIYCFLHCTLFLFMISILILIQSSVNWPSALLVQQAQITFPPYEAKELRITHNCLQS